jgi:hypothetical protein
MSANTPTVVLTHGGFVDGCGWQPVHDVLTGDRFDIAVAQNPTLSLGLAGRSADPGSQDDP